MDRYTKSFSLEMVDGRWRYVRADLAVIVEEDGSGRYESDGSDITDEELAALNATLAE